MPAGAAATHDFFVKSMGGIVIILQMVDSLFRQELSTVLY